MWTSFMDLVHFIGAIGCGMLAVGFGADAETARMLFYAAATLAFTVALVRRRHARHVTAAPARVVDLTTAEAPRAHVRPGGRTVHPR